MKTLCQMTEINRSSYYAWLKRPVSRRKDQNDNLVEKLKTFHRESKGTYGAPRLTAQLRNEGYTCNRKRVAKLMRNAGIFGCARRKFRAMSTTNSKHNFPISPRLFQVENKETLPQAPNRVWVGDMTYIETKEGWLFLTVVLDIFTRKIVGYSMADHQRTETTWEAMKLGILNQKQALTPEGPSLITHSDRGGQYASEYYREKLALCGITQSMSRSGNCYDNAYAESFFHTLKVELTHRFEYGTRIEAQIEIQKYIDWYNRKRLHSALGYQTPFNYERKALAA
jgi:putative transposase